jgi:hypothetical protein
MNKQVLLRRFRRYEQAWLRSFRARILKSLWSTTDRLTGQQQRLDQRVPML